MNKFGFAVAAAAVTYIGLGAWYGNAKYAAVGPIEINADVLKAILAIIAFFLPLIVGQFSPALGELLKKLLAQFIPSCEAKATDVLQPTLMSINRLSSGFIEAGDSAGLNKTIELHAHVLTVAVKRKKADDREADDEAEA